jgi:hypothetical protein
VEKRHAALRNNSLINTKKYLHHDLLEIRPPVVEKNHAANR